MTKISNYNKLITYILIFTLVFPILSGVVLIIPAYAANSLTDNKGFLSMIKGLLMLFFFSFLSNKDNNYLEDSYQPAAQEENNQDASYTRINLTPEEWDLLAKTVYAEARGEPYRGQVAVAAVVLNRVESSQFPNDVEGVVFERPGGEAYAFSAVLDGQIYKKPNQTAYKAVDDALKGWDPSNGALYYYNPIKATANWIFENTVPRVTIGNHIFADLK